MIFLQDNQMSLKFRFKFQVNAEKTAKKILGCYFLLQPVHVVVR